MCGCMLENRVRKLSLSCATLNFNIYIQTMIASIYKRDITSPMLVAFHSKFASYLHQKSTNNSAISQKASHEHVSNHCASGGCRADATSACCCRDADFISISADVGMFTGIFRTTFSTKILTERNDRDLLRYHDLSDQHSS